MANSVYFAISQPGVTDPNVTLEGRIVGITDDIVDLFTLVDGIICDGNLHDTRFVQLDDSPGALELWFDDRGRLKGRDLLQCRVSDYLLKRFAGMAKGIKAGLSWHANYLAAGQVMSVLPEPTANGAGATVDLQLAKDAAEAGKGKVKGEKTK